MKLDDISPEMLAENWQESLLEVYQERGPDHPPPLSWSLFSSEFAMWYLEAAVLTLSKLKRCRKARCEESIVPLQSSRNLVQCRRKLGHEGIHRWWYKQEALMWNELGEIVEVDEA